MNGFVLDASVALRWFLDKPVPAYATRVRRLLLEGNHALVPALWHLEMANGLAIAERRRVIDPADVDQALGEIEQLLSLAIETDSALVSIKQSCFTARSFQLSGYDASYLNLAIRDGLRLATLDDKLRVAAKQAGVELL